MKTIPWEELLAIPSDAAARSIDEQLVLLISVAHGLTVLAREVYAQPKHLDDFNETVHQILGGASHLAHGAPIPDRASFYPRLRSRIAASIALVSAPHA